MAVSCSPKTKLKGMHAPISVGKRSNLQPLQVVSPAVADPKGCYREERQREINWVSEGSYSCHISNARK